MATATAAPPGLMTADEFFDRHGDEHNTDLVDGIVVRYPVPGRNHGYVGNKFCVRLSIFVEDHKLGRVYNNDTFIKVRSNPDRVGSADCAYQSYERFPPDAEVPDGYFEVMPEFVAEVKSTSDSWPEVMVKVNDYLGAGVSVVAVIDPAKKAVELHRPGREAEKFESGATLTIPDLFPGFESEVAGLFR